MNKSKQMGISMVVGGAIGALGVFVGRQAGFHTESRAAVRAVLDIGVWWVFIWWTIAVLIHEIGHMLAGFSQRMGFLFLTVGPFRLRQSVSGLRFEWAGFGMGFGGLTAMMPNADADLSRQLRVLVLGGPLASLLLCAVGGMMILTAGPLSVHGYMLFFVSAFIFGITVLPMKIGPMQTDGAQFVALQQGSREVQVRHQVIALYGQSANGVRPRDWDPRTLADLASLQSDDKRQLAMIAWMRYQHALDARRLTDAEAALNDLLAHPDVFGGGFDQAVAVEGAYFHARYKRNIDTAEQWLAKSQGGSVEPAMRQLAKAALAFAKGNADQARIDAEAGLLQLAKGSSLGINQLIESELRGLIDAASGGAAV
ncbi:hypothetical protein C7S18_18665 [Ahniella affigens]|uniref:Peptidase M50 domain-containing protein n=1 Tax=Ahniella affigens TaxID=2021234 RepID=A0A2P1PW36_9GAMM|nr:M50 family metallopeptidase [Ahniella affigens]AVP99068.1 hypothetical protein C7S18_18665 [Ahniella affigens]